VLLLDTQIVLWLAADTDKISPKTKRALGEARTAGEGLAIAGVTLWELAMLAAKGRIILNPPIEIFLEKVEATYHILPMDRRVAVRAMQFSEAYPNDPADRQIGATAVVHGLSLVTADAKIRRSAEVPCVW
jgi:PIN domain nuclease of toxin-antitoxin system